ncbi:MAG: uroporphyrinogen-III decarboxylase-like protein [Acidobacteria bacterium]|nr:uroporphyrinogen-III decarboxylase-like protein [Acidobacteriota bacterium]
MSRLRADLGCDSDADVWRALGVDKCVFLAPKHPQATEDTWHIPSLFSIWGVPTRRVEYLDGAGYYEEAIDPPLAAAQSVADIEKYRWPKAEDWDYEVLLKECLRWPDYPIVGASYEPFYLYSRLRGMEQALEDLIENPAIADAMMERIFDIHAGIVKRSLETAGSLIDFIYVAEDLGTQESLLMSPRSFRRFIKPWLARMIDLARAYGAHTFHHDDGAIAPLLPELIDIGIDVLNPIQWRAKGMAREGLARQFGSSVVFHGGVDNQHTLPFGSVNAVRKEVEENIAIFSECKGYVVAPCHNLQANTPTRNVVALYEAVRDFGAL